MLEAGSIVLDREGSSWPPGSAISPSTPRCLARIEGVGALIYFEDTEGNLVGAILHDPGVFD
jgi:hypothetical protein